MAHHLDSKIQKNKILEDLKDDLTQIHFGNRSLENLCDVSMVTQLVSHGMKLKSKCPDPWTSAF